MSAVEHEELRLRVREGAPPANAAVVLRGGPDTLALLRSHARRLNRLYVLDGLPIFGISVFVADSTSGHVSADAILATKLRSYPTMYRTTVGALAEAGFGLLPTFNAPHYTVLLPDLDAADDLAGVFGELLVNPYAEGGKEER